MRNSKFPYDYSQNLFGKFTVFINEDGELDVANSDREIVMQSRITGVHQKTNLKEFIDMIKTVFPTRKEQKELLRSMFVDEPN